MESKGLQPRRVLRGARIMYAHGVVMRDWTITEKVREFNGGDGQYAVVKYANETYGITLNGEPLRPFFWHAGQLEDCIFMTSRLAGPAVVHAA